MYTYCGVENINITVIYSGQMINVYIKYMLLGFVWLLLYCMEKFCGKGTYPSVLLL